MMKYGISDLSIIPMRCDQSERSEMVSQILFGELYRVLQCEEKWLYIQLLDDGYEGWIDRKMFVEVSEDFVVSYQEGNNRVTKEIFNIVTRQNCYGNKLIVLGSTFPLFDTKRTTFLLGEVPYLVETPVKEELKQSIRERIIHYALAYYNTPYLWGGRTPYGIDCSGLVQMVYKMVGIQLPRDASQQATKGEILSFVEECLPGDLVFFGNGTISHVGIVWQDGRIIHASGRVRIDKLDHQGIYNDELKKYTHDLMLIRRIIVP